MTPAVIWLPHTKQERYPCSCLPVPSAGMQEGKDWGLCVEKHTEGRLGKFSARFSDSDMSPQS